VTWDCLSIDNAGRAAGHVLSTAGVVGDELDAIVGSHAFNCNVNSSYPITLYLSILAVRSKDNSTEDLLDD